MKLTTDSNNNSNKNWFSSLTGKFILPIATILTFTLGGSAMYTYTKDKNSAYDSINTKVDNLSKLFVQISPNAILTYDFESLNNFMESLTHTEDIVYAVIVSPEGNAMTSYMDEGSEFISNENHDHPHDHNIKKYDILNMMKEVNTHAQVTQKIYPIIIEKTELGNIYVGISNKRIDEKTKKLFVQQLVVSLSIIILLSLIIYTIFKYNTLKPIKQLINGSVRLSKGNLEKKVSVYSNDELGDLAICFNTMMDNLKNNIKEKDEILNQLKDLNRNLENRVEQRTIELIEVNKELEHLALHDTLTGLPNRTVIHDSLKHNIHFSKIKNEQFCVFMMDLDRFKEVNDTLGHDFGDELLVAVSERLSTSLRETDVIARLGGDEFAIILPQTPINDAMFIANKIRKKMEPVFMIQDHPLSISVSIGISNYPQHGDNTTALMKAADVAMYHSKNTHINHCIYHDGLDNRSPDQLNIMGELRDAINNKDLCLFYQPKVDTKSQKIIGVEALVRWNHQSRGLIFPDDFIPLAEQTGLIKPLTSLVLQLAIQQLSEWNKQNINVSMAVNLSMHDVQNDDLPALLSSIIEQNHVNEGQLMLEITESTIMSNPESVMSVLEKIASMGVQLSIDDFGTGYSSLSNLKKMPVNELKIDRSFVMDMVKDRDDRAIVESTIQLAHNMGLKVVAEGVETNEISKQLIELNCDIIQGYYISKPIPVDDITNMLTKESLSYNSVKISNTQ